MDWFDLDLLLPRADLPEVARRLGMDVLRSGSGYLALCPFHTDTKPSMRMFPADGTAHQHFHCFSCNAHGDAIALVKQVRGVDFEDAVQWLASSFGVQPTRKPRPSAADGLGKERTIRGLNLADEVFRQSHRAEEFTKWASARGYSSEFLYDLGFRLVRGNNLVNALKEKPLNEALPLVDELETLGLLHRMRKPLNNPGGSYFLPLEEQLADTFNDGRIIFPIRDTYGKTVGYAGRKLDEPVGSGRAAPKYLNSKGFQKGKYLFNADKAIGILTTNAKAATEHDLYLVEGFMDAIRLQSLGLPAVALMGTSISAEQLNLLEKFASEQLPKGQELSIRLFLDRDVAGHRASTRAIRQLLNMRTAAVVWIAFDSVAARDLGLNEGKDPDDCLRSISAQDALVALSMLAQPAVAALVLDELGSMDIGDLADSTWASISPHRRDRAIFSVARSLRAWRKSVSSWEERLTTGTTQSSKPHWLQELISAMSSPAEKQGPPLSPNLFLQSEVARRNHARALAYHGSRRGELPCDEPTWQCIDVAASVFDTLLVDRIRSQRFDQSTAFDAVHLPRKLSANPKDLADPRLKVMPHPADLIFQQYLLNELLTERHDLVSMGGRSFSECVPAVRYYKSLGRTVVTGPEQEAGDERPVLSFAYQIDMEVLEGQRPPSDQGMFRPYGECWREFMSSLNRQIRQIGRVHVLRLDAKRYYDSIRQYVVRDGLQAALDAALASDWPESLRSFKGEDGSVTPLVKVLCECLFDFRYRHPATGKESSSPVSKGIPQGPVISAWIGTIALFPVDEAARALMKRYERQDEEGLRVARMGYARYVDDIVLVADSADLLRELRETVQHAASQLDLTLLSKGEQIQPGEADAVIKRLNDGRSFAASTPTWEPPLTGDGEWGWAMGDGGAELSRQSALRILRHPELLERPESVLEALEHAVRAPDLRAADLGKCARWIWWRIATEISWPTESGDDSTLIWQQYWDDWNEITKKHDWAPAFRAEGYAALIALEGLDLLFDEDPWMTQGLTGEKLKENRAALDAFAKHVSQLDFFSSIHSKSNDDHLLRRKRLVTWKAMHRLNPRYVSSLESAEKATQRTLAVWFCQATALFMAFCPQTDGDSNPLEPLAPLKEVGLDPRASELPQSYAVWALLCGRQLVHAAGTLDTGKARELAIGLVVAATQRKYLWQALHNYPDLLGAENNFSTLPPLPGVSATHLLGYVQSEEEMPSGISLRAFGDDGKSRPPNKFLGASHRDGTVSPTLDPAWSDQPRAFGPLQCWVGQATLPLHLSSHPHRYQEGAARFAARLFRALLSIHLQNKALPIEGQELVPVIAHLAVEGEAEELKWYLLTEPMNSDDLGANAWIRDGGDSLRSVSIPSGDAHLWRIGVTVSDVLGLASDIQAQTDDPLQDAEVVAELDLVEEHVVRQQLRKLRGEFVGRAPVRHENAFGVPFTVERALSILERFPPPDAEGKVKAFALLETEAETQAMAMRLNGFRSNGLGSSDLGNGIRARLHELPTLVLRRLPLSAIEELPTSTESALHLRSDLAIMRAVARTVVGNEDWTDRRYDSAAALRVGTVLAVAATGLHGLAASLIGTRRDPIPEQYWIPSDWPRPDGEIADPQAAFQRSRTAIQQDLWSDLPHLSPWCWLLMVTTLLQDHLVDTKRFGVVSSLLRSIYDVLRTWEEASTGDAGATGQWTWPFEDLPVGELGPEFFLLLDTIPSAAVAIDQALGFVVSRVQAARYGLNRHDGSFTDANSRTWRMRLSQFTELPTGLRAIERVECGSEVLLVWTEVRDLNGNDQLLSVHAVEDKLAKLVKTKTDLPTTQVIENDKNSQLEEISRASASQNFPEVKEPEAQEPRTPDPESPRPAAFIGRDWRNARRDSWAERARHKINEPGYMRVAFFQWRIDESYSHPLIEAGLNGLHLPKWAVEGVTKSIGSRWPTHSLLRAKSACERGSEYLWDEANHVFSWPEHRRRCLLKEALQACNDLKVDLLVLPEYSVRGETVNWLREQLRETPGLAILAGTYRDPNDLRSPMNLLWMPTDEVQKKLVPEAFYPWSKALCFHRDKKYRAVAVQEFFRPPLAPIAPLFDPAEVVGEILKQIDGASSVVSAHVAAQFIATQLPGLRYCMELICSELFMLSSPANIRPLGRDLLSVRRRFDSSDVAEFDVVREDLESLAAHLDIGHSHNLPRRSILVVPAATGRTSDYWLAGQASVLASATATVFCNGVLDNIFLGGSCFIGNECTAIGQKHAGMIERLTPYHGWSKGIHYGSHHDPLNRKDQALVVVDMNPVHVVEGKPRPQLLPSPMRLVAYLPVVETLDKNDNAAVVRATFETQFDCPLKEDLEHLLQQIDAASSRKSGEKFEESFEKIRSAVGSGKKLNGKELEEFSRHFGDPEAVEQRLRAWERDRLQQPTHQERGWTLPPALLDVLPVDITLRQGRIPELRVPAWTADASIGWPDSEEH